MFRIFFILFIFGSTYANAACFDPYIERQAILRSDKKGASACENAGYDFEISQLSLKIGECIWKPTNIPSINTQQNESRAKILKEINQRRLQRDLICAEVEGGNGHQR